MQVPPSHYFSSSYDIKGRFVCYWHQINEVIASDPSEVLEIGVGNGFVSKYLRERGYKLTTLDYDSELKPDVVSNILSLPFVSKSFDLVICYEILEHLPYSFFTKALKEVRRITKSRAILSLPDVTTVYRFFIELPRLRPIKKMIPHPFPRPPFHHQGGQHHWEIGKKKYPLKRIKCDIKQVGFEINSSYRIFEFPYHRFFLISCQ